MSEQIKIRRRKRISAFTRLVLGIVFDFWMEGRISRKIGTHEARIRMSDRHRKRAIFFRKAAIEMGGVAVKLGQFLGTRADVVPEEYLEELDKLQDRVPAVGFDEIRIVVENELRAPLSHIFSEFNETPEGSASLAQVHIAKLKNGDWVAVKVQRPSIEKLVEVDIGAFEFIMEGLNTFTRAGKYQDIPGLLEQFAVSLGDELDFYRECSNADRFRQNFLTCCGLIHIPKVYWEYTTSRVLTMEAVSGVKVWDFEALEKAGIDKKQVAEKILESFFRMVVDHGFFHADLHPGNLFVLPGPLITYLDFGLVGEITPRMKEIIKEAVIAIVEADTDRLYSAVFKLGFIRRGADPRPIKKNLEWIIQTYRGLGPGELNFERIEAIQEEVRSIIYQQQFSIPASFANLGRAIGVVIGLISALDPGFDFVGAIKPHVDKLIDEMKPSLVNLVVDEAKNYAKVFLNFPSQVQNILAQAEKGQLRVKADTAEIVSAMEKSNRLGLIVPLAAVFLALTGAAVVSAIYRFLPLSYSLFGLALLTMGLFGLTLRRVHSRF